MNPEWISAGGTLLAGLAALVAGWAALRGLGTWRAELVVRRKTELAEEVLAQFYQARDVLTWARTPAISGSRGGDHDAPSVGPHRSLSAPIERITEESELFSQLHANRYRFIAYFGERASSAFEEIRAVHTEVVVAAGELVRDSAVSAAGAEPTRGLWEGAIGWGQGEDDRLSRRVDDAVRQIEQVCLPLIQEGADRHPSRDRKAAS
ncbi:MULTISPECIES: hypothetical protein [unclassified Phenylobacterium]|uniref:hypothetical protein n=1 Tax=unclassified Phenylobacterium TaxID=2640670 RepID=UPI00083B7964|nr:MULTISPECIES: hypothetical protein [unclassified Phenylobacterium]